MLFYIFDYIAYIAVEGEAKPGKYISVDSLNSAVIPFVYHFKASVGEFGELVSCDILSGHNFFKFYFDFAVFAYLSNWLNSIHKNHLYYYGALILYL